MNISQEYSNVSHARKEVKKSLVSACVAVAIGVSAEHATRFLSSLLKLVNQWH
jgi:hypothetical protein